jgi:hypothetical protein
MAKRSSVTPATGKACFFPGHKRDTMKNASTADTAANSTMTSNVTGTNAGREFHGLPPTLMGQSLVVVQYSNQTLAPAPSNPRAKTIHGIRDGGSPMASSMSWMA